MRFLLLIIGMVWANNALAQQHLSKTWSVSSGLVLNAKGINLNLHYHLNAFDEWRVSYSAIQQKESASLHLRTNLLKLEYAAGFKSSNLRKMGTYVGGGFFWGQERRNIENSPANNIWGISFFHEWEYAPMARLSFFTRFKMLIPFTLKRSKTLRLTFGTRFYF